MTLVPLTSSAIFQFNSLSNFYRTESPITSLIIESGTYHELEGQSHLLRRWQHAAVPQSRAHSRAAHRTGHRARWRTPAQSGMPDQESVRWNDDWAYKERQPRPRFLVDVLLPIALGDRTE